MEALCKRFEVRASEGGKVLFSADEDEIVIGADRLRVTGKVIIRFQNGCKLLEVLGCLVGWLFFLYL